MKKSYLLLVVVLVSGLFETPELFAQGTSMRDVQPMAKDAGDPIICYFTPENMFTAVPLRTKLEALSTARTADVQAANFEVTYRFFSPEQQAAFQRAVDIWSALLTSDVTIRIDVTMSANMAEGTLASTGWGGLFANFKNAQKINTWYVSSIAEKMAGEDLNEVTDPDIVMSFNVNRNFYTGLDLQTPAGQFDLVSIALHEIGHGLGFFTHTRVEDAIGEFGSFVGGNPTVYARLMENGDGNNLFDTYTNKTPALGTQLTGGDLYFRSHSFDGGVLPRIYAPSEWNGGSSISHLNETTYPSGNPHSLMTPQIGFAEAIHDPGLSLKMLEDMGWISMDIDHNALLDNEDLAAPNNVVAVITGDNALASSGAEVHYTFTNWAQEVVVEMTPTGNPDEYAAEIPAPQLQTLVLYYISAKDSEQRSFTSPGEAPEFFNQFTVAPDTISPILLHQPLSIVFENDPIAKIVATVQDNLGTNDLIMTYKINNSAPTDLVVPKVAVSTNGTYIADHFLAWDLGALNVKKGDKVEYKLRVTDASANANSAIHPAEDIGFNVIEIDALNPVVKNYTNDFNGTADDFVGIGFEIALQNGFSNGALHSDHPYRVLPGASSEDTVILQAILKSPILLSKANPIIRFDEVVLIEPGEPGTTFGDDQFWDYVVVEGSSDLGVTWFPFEDGYDSREENVWLTHYNSDLVTKTFQDTTYPDSEANGNESLFKNRIVNMLASGDFEAGDEVLIRFKIYADQLATGWGWVVDNLKIQVDDEFPMISHIAPDYLTVGAEQFNILTRITDNTIIDSVTFEINIDGQTEILSYDNDAELFDLQVNINPVTPISIIKYRIIAVDSAETPNTSFLPETGYFEIPVAVLGDPVSTYINDFNSASSDFIGANYIVGTPDNFNDPGIQSLHPYSNSPTGVASMSYLLKYPIKTSGDHAWMSFNEIGLVDNFGDGLNVEVSKDNGATWNSVVNNYNNGAYSDWNEVFFEKDDNGNSVGVGVPSLYRNRLVDLLKPAAINSGDEILVRFTMFVNESRNGWGWAIDDVEIQGPTTAIDEKQMVDFDIYPNPTPDGRIAIQGSLDGNVGYVLVTDLLGQTIYQEDLSLSNGQFNQTLNLSGLKKGIYLVSVQSKTAVQSTRVVVE